MNVLCVIGARGGSKGVPNKNLRLLLGKPLVAYSIEQAKQCSEINRIIVSTDSEQIANVAREFGADVPFLRPAELATDAAAKWPVWQHALAACEDSYGELFDLFVDLDCTSPLRDPSDISSAIRLFRESSVDAVFSVCPARKNPYFNLVEYDHQGYLKLSKTPLNPVVRRQDSPPVYEHVASIYVLSPTYIRQGSGLLSGRTKGYVIDSSKSLDVDTELDFEFIEFLMKKSRYGVERELSPNSFLK